MVEMNRAQELPARAEAPPKCRLARLSAWLGNPWGCLPGAHLGFLARRCVVLERVKEWKGFGRLL